MKYVRLGTVVTVLYFASRNELNWLTASELPILLFQKILVAEVSDMSIACHACSGASGQ